MIFGFQKNHIPVRIITPTPIGLVVDQVISKGIFLTYCEPAIVNIFLFKKISSALQDHLNSEHPADSISVIFLRIILIWASKKEARLRRHTTGSFEISSYTELNAIKPAREFSRCTLDY